LFWRNQTERHKQCGDETVTQQQLHKPRDQEKDAAEKYICGTAMRKKSANTFSQAE
jgi:hypothetical protein